MFYFDPLYMLFVGPALLLALWAQSKVSSAYETYARVRAANGLTGAEVARQMLRQAGIDDVRVEPIGGRLTDHYDPRSKVVRLSEGVFYGSTVAAQGIAAHEVGHAIQHATGYVWLGLRNAIIPVTQFGSQLAFPLFFLGLIMQLDPLVNLGILLFSLAVLFQVITLPVEFNASGRALATLAGGGYLRGEEMRGARAVLQAAALTYVAAMVMAVMQLLYLLALRGRRD
ncbi:peptidase membrane zinc metallopeptidase [Thermaerobacter marianensis DSM 12885]|uniref:Peptidase membrane zinc metallopeptidase n=1 Tax=Thermaerobacter marianensis (strain ATCC 700841 / DSM 12885 / JCM 10246 / 7p75a) TaxID=644966 RepID=E6SJA5_THEM7|nr:zinc metallopeptidase [Thermaerobacter marianensis]ADU51033.1 peptidase membrane zinc metallopeptidase [Thermaerobacter marianensis DSM 12885]